MSSGYWRKYKCSKCHQLRKMWSNTDNKECECSGIFRPYNQVQEKKLLKAKKELTDFYKK